MNTALALHQTGFLAREGSGVFKHVTPEEVDRLVSGTNREQTRLLITVLWSTGARISEVLDINVSGIDFVKNTILINRRKRRTKFVQVFPIPQAVTDTLRLFIRAYKCRNKIFTCDRVSAFRAVRKLGLEVLGRPISPHQFRHGRAYNLVSKGVHPLLVSRALGHASLSSALAYYHPSEDDLRKALQS